MAKFKVELRFENAPKSENITVEMELSLDQSQCLSQRLDLEDEQFTKSGDRFIGIILITALEDIPSHNIKKGDVVFRDWDDLESYPPVDGKLSILSDEEIKTLLVAYKPLWGPDPGYYEKQLLLSGAYDWPT